MTQVTVDLADLEKLVFAAGAIKPIESALNARKNDPFVKPYLEFTDAHDRLATAMRNVRRSETIANWDAPLTVWETTALISITEPFMRIEKKTDYDSLLFKGYVTIGQLLTGASWTGESTPELRLNPGEYVVKLTERGRATVRKEKQKSPSSSSMFSSLLALTRRQLKRLSTILVSQT